jgi:hypothetical protein
MYGCLFARAIMSSSGHDLDGDGQLDLAVFEGASSGLLGPDDLDEAASAIDRGGSADILVHGNA